MQQRPSLWLLVSEMYFVWGTPADVLFCLKINDIFSLLAATPNWMQRALNDLGHTLCSHSPSLRRLTLHSKINPFNLLIMGGALTVVLTQLLIDLE